MAGEERVELVDVNDPDRGVVPFLQTLVAETGAPCDGCGKTIAAGQHYLRVAVLFDTAGMENVRVFDVPTVVWSGIYDDPVCAGLALVKAAETELFTDVFRRFRR